MADRSSPGSALSERLHARADESSIYRRGTPDGGEVYSGSVVKKALRAVGARAMTMDNAIFVDDDFDLSNPEDQALYAHERHHQLESGGTDDHGAHDAEEMAARSIERMVLHRAAEGEDFNAIMRDVADHGDDAPEMAAASGRTGRVTESVIVDDDISQAALSGMLAAGMPYEQIVRELAEHVVDSMSNADENERVRSSASSII